MPITTFSNTIAGLSENITVRFDLFGGSNGSNGTFRMDDFVLNGYTTAVEHWSPAGYRYGYNNKEKDDEVKGSGNSYDFGARMYDSRVGRWLSRDQKEDCYVPISPYFFSLNNPLMFLDIDGNVIYDSKGNKIKIKFNTENGEIESISGTEDKGLMELIFNTYNESSVERETIRNLNDKDIMVQIIFSEKAGLFIENNVIQEIYGLTIQNSFQFGGLFVDFQNKKDFDIRVLIFNATIGANEKNIENTDVVNEDGFIISNNKLKGEIIKKFKEKGSDGDKDTDNAFDKVFTSEEKLKISKIEAIYKVNNVFANVYTLIHETIHVLQYLGKIKVKGNKEPAAYRQEINSFNECNAE